VLPNGPEMATAFLSASVAGVCAPLNPAYRAEELEFYLSDLPAKALIIAGLEDSPARDVARRAGIQIIELAFSLDDPAGVFTIDDSTSGELDEETERPRDDDIALVLHTSGTTSRP
jgi:acyl-CoA synthetase (AMP-forming)/AMP-acid ligase II